MEAERIELSASRPQLDYAWAMWENLATGKSVPVDRLAIQALQKADPTLLLDLGRPRVDWALSPAANCFGLSLGSLDASISPAASSVSPLRLLRSVREGPPEWNGSDFLKTFLQLPSSIFQHRSAEVIATDVPLVLNVQMGSYDIRLQPILLDWLGYVRPGSRPLVAGSAAAQPQDETMEGQQSNQSVYARDSGLSSSAEGRTFRASSGLQQSIRAATAPNEQTDQSFIQRLDWMACRRALQRSVVHVDLEPANLVLAAAGHSQQLEVHLKIPAVSVAGQQASTWRGTLPSGSNFNGLSEMPFRLLADYGSAGSTFPWTVSLQQLGVCTADPQGGLIRIPVLSPLSLKCAVALNEKTPARPAAEDPAASAALDLAIHVDMNAVQVSLDASQVAALCYQVDQLSVWLARISSALSAGSDGSGPQEEPTAADLANNPWPADIGLWLQWAMPRFVVTLDSSGARTILDMEDVTTSVDLQAGQYAKLKTRLTAMSVKLLTRSGKTKEKYPPVR